MELTSLQKSTVEQILSLYNPGQKTVCEFKAPTGSGKTLMASYFISSLIDQNSSDKFIFVIATPSSSSLPEFFEQKINIYKKDLPYSRFEVEHIKSPSSNKSDKTENIPKIIPEQNKVYIFGKSSFGKNRILSEYGIIEDYIKFAIEQEFKIIYIRDEAHIGGEKKDNSEQSQNFETLMNSNATFVLKMTATPNMKDLTTQKVILREKDLNTEILNEGRWLLKTKLESLLNKNLLDTEVLDDAIENFKKIKNEYAKLNIGINPAMLIQVDNDSPKDKEKSKLFNETLENIKKTLNAEGLSWVQYFGGNNKDSNRVYKNNFTLDDITKNNNDIDVVIFKIGPATGWDIPRACMLVQLRNVCSSSLNTQTIGRIKRNPYPNLEKNEITDKYYIYSNAKDEDDDVKMYYYKVKDKFETETFLTIQITNKNDFKTKSKDSKFITAIKTFLKENKNQIIQQVNTDFFDDEKLNNQKTYQKTWMSANAHEIKTQITNPFIFLRDYKRLIKANSFMYSKINSCVKEFAKEENIQEEFIFTVLFDSFKKDLINLYNKTRDFKPKFEIYEKYYDPKDYSEVFSGDLKREISDDYLFDIKTNSIEEDDYQPLDSNPEQTVFAHIKTYRKSNDVIKLWAKNQTTSNIFGNYLDENNNIRSSYFDFIIKFKNDFYLYLEVKSTNDIDKEKTLKLQEAYNSYFMRQQGELFSPNLSKLAIAVCHVDEKHNIRPTVYYDNNSIKDELNKMSFDQILKTLSTKTKSVEYVYSDSSLQVAEKG